MVQDLIDQGVYKPDIISSSMLCGRINSKGMRHEINNVYNNTNSLVESSVSLYSVHPLWHFKETESLELSARLLQKYSSTGRGGAKCRRHSYRRQDLQRCCPLRESPTTRITFLRFEIDTVEEVSCGSTRHQTGVVERRWCGRAGHLFAGCLHGSTR